MSNFLRWVLAPVALVALLSGCGTVAEKPESRVAEAVSVPVDTQPKLPRALVRFLDGEQLQDELLLLTSPWGRNIIVTAEQSYQAASGRSCRYLAWRASSVDLGAEREPTSLNQLESPKRGMLLFCRGQNAWTEVRAVTRMVN